MVVTLTAWTLSTFDLPLRGLFKSRSRVEVFVATTSGNQIGQVSERQGFTAEGGGGDERAHGRGEKLLETSLKTARYHFTLLLRVPLPNCQPLLRALLVSLSSDT